MAHFAHRGVAVIVGLIMLAATGRGLARRTPTRWRGQRGRSADRLFGLVGTAAALYVVQVIVGALQIWTTLAAWAVSLHLALGAAIWGAHGRGRVRAPGTTRGRTVGARGCDRAPDVGDRRSPQAGGGPAQRPTGATGTRAYIALTKPRIIELLLVTTRAGHGPGVALHRRHGPARASPGSSIATLVGGTLAAGAANAINCYLDRDIDQLMVRTRRRPLPAHEVAPQRRARCSGSS